MTDGFDPARVILRVLAGSRSHGLDRAGSDTDTRGVCIPPARFVIGLSSFEQHSDDSGDNVVYALDKFVRLALDGNPNIIESLYVEQRDVLDITPAGARLRDARDIFLTSTVGERFVRYGVDQLQRIQRHYRWLKDPPGGKPRQEDWGATRNGSRWRFPHTDAERGYRSALNAWKQFERWRAERNPDRALLEEQHGYDTKHAMHLCRLLRMGNEILTEGVVRVRRPDADWLLSVRDGAMRYDDLIAWTEPFVEALPALLAASALPSEPDRDAAEDLVMELHADALRLT